VDTSWIKGVITPLITPVDDEECIDEAALRRVVDFVLDGGVHGILALGSNGEFFGLPHEEQEKAVTIIVDQVQGRVPVYAGIGAISTKECVKLARKFEQCHVQAITLLPPMFISPNEEEMYTHFKTIAEAIALPILIYNNPDRLMVNISANLIKKLASIPNIVGVKDSSGDLALTAEYIRRTRDKGFKVMAGRDILILGSLVYGAVGCVASTANFAPALVVEIYDKYIAGNLEGALDAQFRLAPLRLSYNLGSFPVVAKDALNLLGLEVGAPIKPNVSCNETNLNKLSVLLKNMK